MSALVSAIMNSPIAGVVQRTRPVRSQEEFCDDQVYLATPPRIEEIAEAADRLIEGQKVILNLCGVGLDHQQRMVDFMLGIAYGLGGEGKQVAESVFMFVPEGVSVETAGIAPFAQSFPPHETIRPRVIR